MNYLNVASFSPTLKVADVTFNTKEIIRLSQEMAKENVKISVFPELSLTSYSGADLFFTKDLLNEAQNALSRILDETKTLDMVILVGLPHAHEGRLFNVAAVLFKGKILGMVPKQNLPDYNEFYESRWFTAYQKSHGEITEFKDQVRIPFGNLLFKTKEYTFGVEICEDLFATVSPSSSLSLQGAEIIFNLSASNELVGKSDYRKNLVNVASAKNLGAYVYSSAGVGESTTDLVFSGHLLISEYGYILAENHRFSMKSDWIHSYIDLSRIKGERLKNSTFRNESVNEIYKAQVVSFSHENYNLSLFDREISPHPFVPKDLTKRKERAREILKIQSHGLAKRIHHIGIEKTVIGISGGLDSTLALLVIVKTYEILGLSLNNIITVTMPGFGTTDRTYENALILCKELGTDLREIHIKEAALLHFKDIGHDPNIHDATYENVQARERTQILMDIANKENGIVVGTGDLSELALGWCTYNGDQMSMYGVNSSVPKTLVRYLIQYLYEEEFSGDLSNALKDILETPISPELLPKGEDNELVQLTEESIGPYELHDFFLYYIMKYGESFPKILFMANQAFKGQYSEETIKKWLKVFIRRFFTQQFKRSAMPDGPKVGSIALSPRGDLRMASDASFRNFIESLD
ncbi:MAG: NAD(+) synthase [Clostridium sp.]|nr:NAD(+) synthase [Clostridium sp.]